MSDLLQMLWTQTWQIAVLAIMVAFCTRTITKNRPHLAHAMWLLVVVKCVTPPIWGHSLGVFSQLQSLTGSEEKAPASTLNTDETRDAVLSISSALGHSNEAVPLIDVDIASGAGSESLVTNVDSVASNVPGGHSSDVPESKIADAGRSGRDLWPGLLLSFLTVGAAATWSLMIARCLRCLRSIHRHRTIEFDDLLTERLQLLSKKLRLRRVPRIIVSNVLFGPAVLGVLRHTIVLPRCLLETSRQDLQYLDPILAHELLHIRRGDLRTGLLQVIVQSFWWFHPAVWFCNRWLSREAERCCDEQVIAELGCLPALYARSLLSVIESKHALQPIPVFPGMKPVEITTQRMERIMSLKTGLKKQTPLWCWLAIAVLAVVVLPGAIAKPAPDEETIVTQLAEMSEPHPSRQMDTAPVQLSTKEYIVGDLTERLAKEQNLSLEQAKQSLVEMFEGSVSPVHRVAPRVVAAPAIVQQPALPGAVTEKELLLEKSGRIEQLSSYVFKDDHLIVTQSDAGHAELQMHLERVRRLGFLQFQLSARYVMGPAEDINFLMESQNLEKPFTAEPGRKSDSRALKSTDEPGKEPVTFQISHSGVVSIEQARKIEELACAKADRFSLQRPKVIAFNGQIATIRFGETKPFIVGFKENGEPTIRTMDEGLTLRVTPTVVDTGRFRLKSLASVESASVLRQVNAPGKVTETPRSFHIPGITTKQIQTTVELRDDQTLYLTGLTTAKDGKEQAVLVMLEATLGDNRTLLNANPEGNSSDEKNDDRPIILTYNVADLVTQLRTRDAEMDFSPLVELIRTSIEPESWETGRGTIIPHKETISLLIRQNQNGHDQIQKMLSQLRKSFDSVKISSRLMKLTADSQLKGLEQRCSLHALDGGQRWGLLTQNRSAELQKFLTDEKVELFSCPAIVTISGQPALIEMGEVSDAGFNGFRLSANPHVIADSNVIRLSHSAAIGELKKNSGVAVHESLVGSGQTLVLLIERPGKTDGTPDRYVVMLTPEHLKEEEESSAAFKE